MEKNYPLYLIKNNSIFIGIRKERIRLDLIIKIIIFKNNTIHAWTSI